MSESAIQAAAQAAVALAVPGAKDWSQTPADILPDNLPAFTVTVTRDGAIPAAMGADLEEVQLTVEVEYFAAFASSDEGRTQITAAGEAIRAALRSDPALQALSDYTTGATLEVELAQKKSRMGRATVTLSVEATF